ncbi:MAG: D-alanyl-D-alanine carboxypeptidase/D-alanyl-D-alanine-endopeptidase [Planctomycetia bacterium]|nr:D-alanyl-D-alanine carboxypeptidase/D-alanyl-D-alanine-endopeptidase [Planctomycetia bacterium]
MNRRRFSIHFLFCCASLILQQPLFGQDVATPIAKPTTAPVAVPAATTSTDETDRRLIATLRSEIEPVLDAPEFKHSHWGVLVVDATTGNTLYERNGDKLFAPASVTKLFSVAAAFDELGGDHKFETPLYARGNLDPAGVLEGDLILAASGDPTMGGRTDEAGGIALENVDHTYAGYSAKARLTKPDPLAGLDRLAKQAYERGLREVHGAVLVDDRLFHSAMSSGSGPSRVSPITINDNVLDFTFTPGATGKPAEVDWRPKTSAYTIDSQVTTGASSSKTSITIDEPLRGTITIRGTIPHGHVPLVLTHEVEHPASFARSLLIEALRRAGVRVEASPLVENTIDKLPRREAQAMLDKLAVLESPRFAEEMKLTLKVSLNLHATMMPLLVATKHGKRTMAEGLRLEREALARLGVDVDTISFAGGAGGDRGDYVTPRATVQLLTAMAKRPDFETYRDALPILGVDGTLANAVEKSSPALGKVRAKTGTLSWSNLLNDRPLLQSKALAGYAETKSGRTVVFAFFVNLVHIKESADRERIGRVLGTLCEKLHGAL